MDLLPEQKSAIEIKQEFSDDFMKQLEIRDSNMSFVRLFEPSSHVIQFNSIGGTDIPVSGILIEKYDVKIKEYYFLSASVARHITQHNMDYDSSKSFSSRCIYCGKMDKLDELNPCFPSNHYSIHKDCYSDLQSDLEKIIEHASGEFILAEI